MMGVREVQHLDPVRVQALVVDQSFREFQRSRRAVRLDVDLTLEAPETMAVRIQEILVEGEILSYKGSLEFGRP